MGFEVEAGHHEVAPGQHEIDFRYAEALETADNLATFRFIVRYAAYRHGFLATFMPKPIFGINGSGMHTHQSRSEEHTSELQSQSNLVCRLLLEKKKKKTNKYINESHHNNTHTTRQRSSPT